MVGNTIVPIGNSMLYSNLFESKPTIVSPPTFISFNVATDDFSISKLITYTLSAPFSARTYIRVSPFTPPFSTYTTCSASNTSYSIVGISVVPIGNLYVYSSCSESNPTTDSPVTFIFFNATTFDSG